MKPQFTLRVFLLTVSITGLAIGLYLRSIQLKPLRYLSLGELLREMDLQPTDIAKCPLELSSEPFEVKEIVSQRFDYRQHKGLNTINTVTDPSGARCSLSERTEFADADRAHFGFLVRPKDSQTYFWLILKGPSWSELGKQGLTLNEWYHQNESRTTFSERYCTRPY